MARTLHTFFVCFLYILCMFLVFIYVPLCYFLCISLKSLSLPLNSSLPLLFLSLSLSLSLPLSLSLSHTHTQTHNLSLLHTLSPPAFLLSSEHIFLQNTFLTEFTGLFSEFSFDPFSVSDFNLNQRLSLCTQCPETQTV